MKKFLLKITAIVLMFCILDIGFGFLVQQLRKHAVGGSTRNDYYVAELCDEEVLIFGSSRAVHHYVPSVVSNIMGYSCYNCGKDGMGSIFAYARFRMITERYTPTLVIYDVTPSFDYYVDDNTKYLGHLKPDYDRDCVREIIDLFLDPFQRLMLNSNMIRNNSLILPYLIDNIVDRYEDENGYIPLYGNYSSYEQDLITHQEETYTIDSTKLNLIENLILDCKTDGIVLVFVISPTYDGYYSEDSLQPILQLANQYNVPLLDYSDWDVVAYRNDLFQDRMHLNDSGASMFTEALFSYLIESGIISVQQ